MERTFRTSLEFMRTAFRFREVQLLTTFDPVKLLSLSRLSSLLLTVSWEKLQRLLIESVRYISF